MKFLITFSLIIFLSTQLSFAEGLAENERGDVVCKIEPPAIEYCIYDAVNVPGNQLKNIAEKWVFPHSGLLPRQGKILVIGDVIEFWLEDTEDKKDLLEKMKFALRHFDRNRKTKAYKKVKIGIKVVTFTEIGIKDLFINATNIASAFAAATEGLIGGGPQLLIASPLNEISSLLGAQYMKQEFETLAGGTDTVRNMESISIHKMTDLPFSANPSSFSEKQAGISASGMVYFDRDDKDVVDIRDLNIQYKFNNSSVQSLEHVEITNIPSKAEVLNLRKGMTYILQDLEDINTNFARGFGVKLTGSKKSKMFSKVVFMIKVFDDDGNSNFVHKPAEFTDEQIFDFKTNKVTFDQVAESATVVSSYKNNTNAKQMVIKLDPSLARLDNFNKFVTLTIKPEGHPARNFTRQFQEYMLKGVVFQIPDFKDVNETIVEYEIKFKEPNFKDYWINSGESKTIKAFYNPQDNRVLKIKK